MTNNRSFRRRSLAALGLAHIAAMAALLSAPATLSAEDALPWQQAQSQPSAPQDRYEDRYDVYRERPPAERAPSPGYGDQRYEDRPSGDQRYDDPRAEAPRASDSYPAPAAPPTYGEPYRRDDRGYDAPRGDRYASPQDYDRGDRRYDGGYQERYDDRGPPPPYAGERPSTYSEGEIMRAGHSFFGSVSKGLANAIEYTFRNSGRPNGYILGEDAGGAVVAGLRYGEGTLYTRDAGDHKVFWQGPTLGYDFGAEGSKVMVLVYDMYFPDDIYQRFGGVQGSAYLVGGVSVQLQKHEHVTLAVIRSGVGLRLGANVGYLKYTRSPTWNPF
ncbi:MAG: EipA family protein [Hyphomicrobiaceae bacterium]|nr:EipA family protein [Hyphomicrobiaceae bacterium]